MNFTQEELKTVIGCLQLDLRGNWAYSYSDRLIELISLVEQLPPDDEDAALITSIAQRELDEPFDGRAFRGGYLYGYQSEEGKTQRVKDYLDSILTQPEYNNIEVSTMYLRDQKLNDMGI